MALRFCDESDLLRYENKLDDIRPRLDLDGNKINDWNIQIDLAMDEVTRRLRNHKDVPEQFEIGRVGIRTRKQLRDAVACLALHFLFVAADPQSDTGFY